jgi:hypothetical protein
MFDTLETARKLQESGLSQQQAEGFVEAFKDVVSATNVATVDTAAVKKDIARIEGKINFQNFLLGFIAMGVLGLVLKAFV